MNAHEPNVLLIGGAMRSGTTVIHRALCSAENSNPYISESWYLSDLMALYRNSLTHYEVGFADQFGDVNNLSELIWLNVRKYISLVSEKYHHPDVIIIKHPELTHSFNELAQQFDNFKFIVIIRDPRDVIASMMRASEVLKKNKVAGRLTHHVNIGQYCNTYLDYYKQFSKKHAYFEDRLLFIRYEDFMQNTLQQLQKITHLTGARYDLSKATAFLPQDQNAPNLTQEKRNKVNFSSAFWSDLYRKPITTERIGRYVEFLTESQIKEIESRLNVIGQIFKYW